MTQIVAKIIICFLAVTQIPLAGEVFAQENPEVVNEAEITTDTSQDGESDEDSVEELEVTEQEEVEEDRWFTTEQVGGGAVGDFVVGPGRSEITAKPGDTLIVEILITNRISDDREFRLEAEDVIGSDTGRSLVSVPNTIDSPYSVKDYISFPSDTFDLKLGERAKVPVTITVPQNAEPGGFYGSVMVSTVRKGSEPGALVPTSPIIARIGSLIFLTVEGEVEQSGETLEISTINQNGKAWYETGPIEFGVTYENTGSVHLNPYGEVSIKNMIGEEVGFVELEPWFVLPKSLRLREMTWDREFLFGRYTVEAQINRGYDDVVDTVTTSFWVLPWRMVGGIFLVLFIVIFGIRAFFRTFEFKRKGD